MIRQAIWAAALATIVGCSSKKVDPWSACATAGPVGYGEQPATCTDTNCRQCASVLSQAWRDRQQPAWRGKFNARFIRSAAGAREVVIQQTHPEGEFAFQHCTAGMASGARCAAYSDACATTLADALLASSDDTTHRDAARTALRNACVPARSATLRVLQHCEAFAEGPYCTDDACRACTDRHLQVIQTLAASLPAESVASAFDDLARNTAFSVANDLMGRLRGRELPTGIEQATADQVVHSYCFQLREGESPVPSQCLPTWGEALTHANHPDYATAWTALEAAAPMTRKNILTNFLVSHEPSGELPTVMTEHLRTLPLAGTREAIVQVMRAAGIQAPTYDQLHQVLVDRGVTGDDLPPAVNPNAPPPGVRPRVAPRPAPPAQR